MLRNALISTVFITLFFSCSNKKGVKPAIVLVNTNTTNTVNCFGQNTILDTLNDRSDKKLNSYFNSMVPAPSRSSMFMKRD